MENFILYLIRTSIAQAAFYLAYLLLFKKGKHFLFNRIYLTGSMLVSFLIPLITFYVDAPQRPLMVDLPATQLQTELNADIFGQPLSWQLIAGLIFISGFLGFLFKLIAGHLKTRIIIKRTEKEILNDIHFLISKEDIHPFTYFNQIVIPSDILKRSYLNIILQHEQVHVKEQHTIDVCIAELLFLFQWFNPFVWLLKDAIKDNLEFLTDDRIIRYADRQSYQLAMVMLAGKSGGTTIFNRVKRITIKKQDYHDENKKSKQKAVDQKTSASATVDTLDHYTLKPGIQSPNSFPGIKNGFRKGNQ
ncbi:MAG: M56 family metallopeptidase [Mangrovibacterium sp.]